MNMIVTDEEIEVAFKNTNFGRVDHRVLLQQSVFKRLVGYECGFMITKIMRDLNLTGKANEPTAKGKEFVALAYHDQMIAGG